VFVGDDVLQVGETRFFFQFPLNHVPDGHLDIEKSRSLLEAYIDLWARLQPRRVVELGIRRGGSTALMSELGGLERLVSVELSDERVTALDGFIAERGLEAVVRPFYGVDQSDRNRLRAIMDEEFGSSTLDLVIDDASHLYEESKASFEVLFPRLRPGGLYLLEDWSWQHITAATFAAAIRTSDEARRLMEASIAEQGLPGPPTPMSRLALELVIARAISGDVVADLSFDRDWVVVRRGPATLDPDTFRVDEHAPDDVGVLTPISTTAPAD
jgi:predicted O-methyltransferase YrrM